MYTNWYEANEMVWLAEQEAREWMEAHPEEWGNGGGINLLHHSKKVEKMLDKAEDQCYNNYRR